MTDTKPVAVRVAFPGTPDTQIVAYATYPRQAARGFFAIDDSGNILPIDEDGFPVTSVEPDISAKVKYKGDPPKAKADADSVKKSPAATRANG